MLRRTDDTPAHEFVARQTGRLIARDGLDFAAAVAKVASEAPPPLQEAVIEGWNAVADKLDAQGEYTLGCCARYFAMHLPPVLTDRERLADKMLRCARAKKPDRTREDDRVRDRTLERTR